MQIPGEDAMKWKQLPKQKRDHLILVTLITAVLLGGLGFGLLQFQYDHLARMASDTVDAQKKLTKMKDAIRRADQIETELAETTRTLASLEEGMAAAGDVSAWVYDTVRRFKLAYQVQIPQFSNPSAVTETSLLPKFPYKQVTITVAGNGYYHDIGKFIADFENQFPHIRLLNLSLEPISTLIGDAKEKLEFRVDLVTLVRPNSN